MMTPYMERAHFEELLARQFKVKGANIYRETNTELEVDQHGIFPRKQFFLLFLKMNRNI